MNSQKHKNSKLDPIKLSRADKILLVLYELSRGKRKGIRYEDIVVAAFKKYPQDFQLRGYSQYPDSGDLVHKPLYDFRKKGFIEANNKVFTFTQRGLLIAVRIKVMTTGRSVISAGKLSRYAEEEAARITTLEGFRLFIGGEEPKITDTDFYNYLGVTARTQKNDFLGRLQTVTDTIEELKSIKITDATRSRIPQYHKFMIGKFKHIIDFKSK